jgi:splicing factor 1
MSSYSNGSGIKREFSRDDGEGDGREERKRKRKSRWGNSDTDRVIIPGLPTVLPSNITPEQEKTYLCEYHVIVLCDL